MNIDFVSLMHGMGLLHWYNLIEIGCYSTFMYYFSRWLARDTQKNLVMPFYGYCLLLCLSYTLGFSSLYFLLLYAAPVVFIGFILLHQTTLQKNFIAMTKHMQVKQQVKHEWIDIVMQGSLHAINTNKKFLIVIEHNDDIMHCLQADYSLNAPLVGNVLEFLLDSPHYDDKGFIVIDAHGYLKAVNARWLCGETANTLGYDDAEWLSYCLALTHKTDAMLLSVAPELRLFTACVQGKLIENITVASVITLLKSFMQPSLKAEKNTLSSTQGVFNESFVQKSTIKQTRA